MALISQSRDRCGSLSQVYKDVTSFKLSVLYRSCFSPSPSLSSGSVLEQSLMSEQASKLVGTPNKWSAYAGEIYRSRKSPQPLGTVVFDEIEQQAREKLKDYPGGYDRS